MECPICHIVHKKVHRMGGKPRVCLKEKVGVKNVHIWLYQNYGKPKICEGDSLGIKCRNNSSAFDWALLNGKTYERKRLHFARLCRSCHRRYDFRPRLLKGMLNNLKPGWNKGISQKKPEVAYGWNFSSKRWEPGLSPLPQNPP